MINPGDPVKANVVNEAFCSRKVDTDTVGKFSLLKPVGSGPTIDDTQKFINQLASILGTFENDPASLDYASNFVIADNDPYKVALEKLDAYALVLRNDLNALDAREAANHAAQQNDIAGLDARLTTVESLPFTFVGDKTFADTVTIQQDLIVDGNLIVNGTQTILNTIELTVEDKIITLNKNGLSNSGFGSGLEVEEGGNVTGFARTTLTRDSWEFKAPNRLGMIELEPDTTATTLKINRALFDSKVDAYFPASYRIAGENIPAGAWAVRFGNASLSENTNHIYLSDSDFSLDKFQVVGIVVTPTGELASSTIPANRIIRFGLVDLGSAYFSTSDIGKIIYLSNSGGLSVTPPTSPGEAVVKIGYLVDITTIFLQIEFIGVL